MPVRVRRGASEIDGSVRTTREHVFVVSDNPYAKKGRPSKPGRNARLIVCPRHGLVVHHRYGGDKRPHYRCKRCVGEAVTRRLRKVKQTLVDDFGGGCVICGYDRVIGNLCFHHVDPTQKSFGITMAQGRSLAAYREEAKKCILVCANCHGEIEAGVIPSPPAGTKLRSPLSLDRLPADMEERPADAEDVRPD